MESSGLKIKLYDVSLEQEKNVIKKLRKALFPKANKQKYWEIIKEWYSWTVPYSPVIRIEDAMEKTTFGKKQDHFPVGLENFTGSARYSDWIFLFQPKN